MTVTTKLDTYLVEKPCSIDSCLGKMVACSVQLLSCPPQTPHKCDICGKRETYGVSYPARMHTQHPEVKT